MVSAPTATMHAPTGMVCSVDHLASAAGIAMLRAGGSAVDAAIATNAVLAVTAQHLCGMGGDLFALVHVDGRPVAALNASGRAGSGADADRLRDEGGTRMPFHGDVRSVPVPGCVDGWLALHNRFGRLSMAHVLAPAHGYAADGFPASPTLVASAAGVKGWVGADDYAGLSDRGQLVRRPGVADALDAIAGSGRAGYYGGAFGEGLLALGGGEYTADDLARVQADWVDPLGVLVGEDVVWTIPPNSQGYLTLAGWWMANEVGVPDDPDDPAWAHLLVEAARQAGRDRLTVLHEGADGAALVSPDRLARRAAAIDVARAAVLGPPPAAAGGTTYLCAVDGDRMGVSLIQSNASGFGSGLVEPTTRIFLQNRGIGFSLHPGHPAEYGPGRRPPHTLCPALVTDASGSRLRAVLGTMGGDTQPQILLQVLARSRGARQSPAAVLGAGRWGLHAAVDGGTPFDTWQEEGRVVVRVEGHAPTAWDDGLRARGHVVERMPAWDHGFGHAHLIEVDHATGVLAGAADPRPRTGAAHGY